MKKMKRCVAFLLALVFTFVMNVPVFADTEKTYDITIQKAEAGHTYEAYQILAGNLDEKGEKLSNIAWGSGITEDGKTALGDAAAYAEALSKFTDNSDEAKAAAETLNGYAANPAGSVSVPDGSTEVKISGLASGYYLVKDKDGSLAGTTESYTSYILVVVKDETITPKTSTTTVEKKVQDKNDTTGETTGWQDSADYDIGDDVPFQLTAALAENVSSYKTYKLVFHDTLSAGLTYNSDYAVTVDGKDVTSSFAVNSDGTNLTFSCDDVKILGATDGSKVVVTYTAQLNENAVLGVAGNPNDVYLEFSNNPNAGGEGETGNTPKDTVIVFTYKVVVNKIDGEQKPLTGAQFTLYKKLADGTEKEISYVEISDAQTTVFTFKGLDDGTYVLKETKTPDGYNTIPDQTFNVVAEHDVLSETPALTSLTGNVSDGTITFTPVLEEGSLTTDVVNKSGATLPSTGGAGRVVIYVIGAVLVLGAGVFLVTKKRVRR